MSSPKVDIGPVQMAFHDNPNLTELLINKIWLRGIWPLRFPATIVNLLLTSAILIQRHLDASVDIGEYNLAVSRQPELIKRLKTVFSPILSDLAECFKRRQ